MDLDSLILIDWKSVGQDYLAFFPETYPELDFLRGDDWEALCDDLAHEMPPSIFDPLSAFLVQYGYELWNADDGSDSYNLALVPVGNGVEFTENLREIETEEGELLSFECERLGIEAAWAAAATSQVKQKKRRRFEIVEETDWHSDYGRLGLESFSHRLLDDEDEDGCFTGLADLAQFPFAYEEADGLLEMREQGHAFDPLYTRGVVQYWAWTPPALNRRGVSVGQKIVLIDDFNTPRWRLVEEINIGPGEFVCAVGSADTMFALVREASGSMRSAGAGGACLYRIRDALSKLVCHIEGEAHLVPISPDLVVSMSRVDPARPLVINTDTGEQRRLQLVGADVRGLFAINENLLGFITEVRQPHTELDSILERTAYLNTFNLMDGTQRRARLQGLHNTFTHDTTVMRDQPDIKVTVRSFEGFIIPVCGHEGWVVLNYLTSYPGKYDRAWFWNTVTDDVLKVTPHECPRLEPVFHFLPSRQRYVGDSPCRIDLLKPFEVLEANLPGDRLVWEPVASV